MRGSGLYLFIVAAVLGGSAGGSYGLSISTPAAQASRLLLGALEGCVKAGVDLDAVTMRDVMGQLNADAVEIHYGGHFNFQLLQGRGPLEPRSGRRLIAYSSEQILEDGRGSWFYRPGRYGIWLRQGEMQIGWETEERMQELLASVGLPLTKLSVWKQPRTALIAAGWGGLPRIPTGLATLVTLVLFVALTFRAVRLRQKLG